MLNITYNTFNDSQQKFEDFVCCLAYSLKPENAKENSFVNLNGRGGDGGVECFWNLNDGNIHAYQAKYINQFETSQQTQIKESFEKACNTFPNLTRYCVYTALDGFTNFNDKTFQKKRRGRPRKGLLEKKDNLIAKLKAIKNIEINIYTLAEITNFIIHNGLVGITNFFTNDKLFTPKWFYEKAENSIINLGERFTPEKHIHTETEEILNLLLQSKKFEKILCKRLSSIRRLNYYRKDEDFNEDKKVQKLHVKISNSIEELHRFAEDYKSSKKCSFNLYSIKNILNEIKEEIDNLIVKAESYKISKYDYSRIYSNTLSDIKTINYSFYNFEHSDYLDFTKNLTIVKGDPGRGKSHLLAKLMIDLIEEGSPAILLLGASLNRNIEKSILNSLDCHNLSFEDFLKTLDISALSSGRKAIIFIDAINESSTQAILDTLPELVNKIEHFENIKVVVSCRTDFFDLYIREDLVEKSSLVTINGFDRYVEWEKAMKVYFDDENKERPFFSFEYPIGQIPLFIKLLSALPNINNGVNGIIELLKSYLLSISKNIAKKHDTLPDYVEQSIFDIARVMVKNKKQSIQTKEARLIITNAFGGIANPPNKPLHWADIFCDEHIFRKEFQYTRDILGTSNQKYAFQYQTITSYLLVASIIEKIDKIEDIFAEGNFGFLLTKEGDIEYDFIDLFKALAVFIPEKFRGKEIYHCLPKKFNDTILWDLDQSFFESLIIRNSSKESFSKSTIELVNLFLENKNSDILEVLLKLSSIKDNPFNALFLNNFLKSKTIAERDSYWTEHLNFKIYPINIEDKCYSERSDISNIQRVMERIEFTSDILLLDAETIKLTSLVLCWGLTSTNRILRDRITRSLVKIYLAQPNIFISNLNNFKDIDDLYILERILSAAYGGVLIDNKLTFLLDWSIEIYNLIFSNNTPPSHLILRNNARQIIEIANKKNILVKSINMDFVRPPYNTEINLNLKNKEREYFEAKYGDTGIFSSCLGGLDDFGRYTIEGRISEISNVSLSKKQPLTNDDKFKVFKNDILSTWSKGKQNKFKIIERNKEEIEKLKKELLKNELSDFIKFAEPSLFDHREIKYNSIDEEKAKLWIVKKAYEIGFTAERFPNDRTKFDDYERGRPLLERIGKKYQWLAFYDLLAKLTDNYWIFNPNEYYEYKFKRYDTPRDLGILEDIDPSIQIDKLELDLDEKIGFIDYKSLIGINYKDWFNNSKLEDNYQSKNYLEIKYNDDDFITLYCYVKTDNKNDFNAKKDLEQWNRLNSYILNKEDSNKFLKSIKEKRLEDPDISHPPHDYEGKLYEYIKGYTDINHKLPLSPLNLDDISIETSTFQINDDSNIIDIDDSYKFSEYIPNLKLREHLKLQCNPNNIREYLNNEGTLVFKSFYSKINSTTTAIISKKEFFKFLKENNLVCIWATGGEKLLLKTTEIKIEQGMVSNTIYISTGTKIEKKHNSYKNFFEQRKIP